MNSLVRFSVVILLMYGILLGSPAPAKADRIEDAAIGVGVAIGAVGIAIGFGIYYAVHHDHSIKGCVTGEPGSLLLTQKDDPQVWTLIGDTAGVHAGDRVRVVGKRKKKAPDGSRQFIVEKLGKDYGPCQVSASAH